VQRPPNLSIVVLDNGHYGETGMQRSHTAAGVDLAAVASACGFGWSMQVDRAEQIADLRARVTRREGTGFATVRIAANDPPRVLPSRDGVEIKNRFRRALGLPTI
jgi:thiamine pyrophosphate-dependent acetolactate synthase large subunit-like protein